MRAVVVDRWMEPKDLRVSEIPEPTVGEGSLGIEIRAAGCNFFDILLVQGQYQMKPSFPFIPGAEAAGTVSPAAVRAASAAGATRARRGYERMGYSGGKPRRCGARAGGVGQPWS